MEYTNIILGGAGLIGIVLHNLIKLDSINRSNDGHVNFSKYMALERFSILISLFVVAACVMASHEIKQLQIAGNYLALGFVAIGYLAQSILVKYMGKAQKFVNRKDTDKP